MKFRLYLDYSYCLVILRDGQAAPDNAELISERDPEAPMKFEDGLAYFNPLLSGKDGQQVFLVGDENLIGYRSGRPPVKRTKSETIQQARGWFMIPRAALRFQHLSQDICHLIERSPKLSGVICQRLRAQLGLRIPEDLAFPDKEGWIGWLAAQTVQLSPTLKNAFTLLYTAPQNLIFSKENREHMLSGVEPELKWQILIRWVEIRQVMSFRQKLFESMEWALTAPENIAKADAQTMLAYANKNLTQEWARLDNYHTGENQGDDPLTEKVIFTGPLIYRRQSEADKWDCCTMPKDWENFDSIGDILSRAIRTNEEQ